MPPIVENIAPDTLTDEQRHALALLVHMTPDDLALVKHVLHLGMPAVVGPQTLDAFEALCAAHGLDLTEAGILAFKRDRYLGNGAEIGTVTAGKWAAELFMTQAISTPKPQPGRRHISPAGISMIKNFEGWSARSYRDQVGVLTIGYGHTAGVRDGQVITPEHGEELLRGDLAWAEQAVNDAATAPMTDHQFDAFTSFTFNCGAGALRSSSVLRDFNAGRTQAAADDFMKWVNGDHGPIEGLVIRRRQERALFLS